VDGLNYCVRATTTLSAKIPSHCICKLRPLLKITPDEIDKEATQGITDGGHVLSGKSIRMGCQSTMGEDVAYGSL
jgi:hypothetical protein